MKLNKETTWEAFMAAIKEYCGFIMLGDGRFTLVDEDVMSLAQLDKQDWGISTTGYAVRWRGGNDSRSVEFLHRKIVNPPTRKEVDHKNRNRLDNRRCNLRICTRSENAHNNGGRPHGRLSKFRGVRQMKHSGRWVARGVINGMEVHLGCYATDVDAARVYNEWAVIALGEFACLNQI